MFALFLIAVILTVTEGANLQCTRQSLGCWRDTGNRAIAGGIRFNSLNVDDCMKYAADRGWSVFAVQYNSECFTAPDAEHTYRKYGGANNCAHGRGGGWANSVYKVSCKPAFTCKSEENGQTYNADDSYINDNGQKCTCSPEGFVCLCEGSGISCPAGSSSWTDQLTCKSSCIKQPGYCTSSGDPHYRSFDGKYYDFHGTCSYQAASCDDFEVYLKNVDLYGRAPRFTKRGELHYKGKVFAVGNGYEATVDGQKVQLPYEKKYTSGDYVKIINNGQLEIVLYQYSKGRVPATRIRANNAGRYINAEITLHGSCAGVTEGMCGNWNGNPGDDLEGGSPNSMGNIYQGYDENCPAPPKPYHPCDEIPNGLADATAICDALKGAPFSSCHSTVNYGNNDGGIYKNCLTDVCNCFMDSSCACSQYETYAVQCTAAGVDISNWRESVDYCPYDCPEGLSYFPSKSIPAATCLDRSPKSEGKARGCFCPDGQFLQDGVCVDASKCQCIYEGKFYNVGDEIKKDSECQTCTCQDAGNMQCTDFKCPALSCAANEVEAHKEDACCGYCASDWVKAVNPEVKVNKGQTIALTCEVDVNGVVKRDITWSKDGEAVTSGISEDRKVLKVRNADAASAGSYKCQATKNGKTDAADFTVEVEIPVPPRVEVSPVKSIVNCRRGKACKIQFEVTTTDGSKITKKNVKICAMADGKRGKCKKGKGKKSSYKISLGKKAKSGDYVCVVTLDGKEYVSDAMSVKAA